MKLADDGSEHPWDDPDPNLAPAIALEFSTIKRNVSVIVKRKEGDGDFESISSWLGNPSFNEADGSWKFKYYDKTSDSSKEYTYRLKLMNKAGLELDSSFKQPVPVPNGGVP